MPSSPSPAPRPPEAAIFDAEPTARTPPLSDPALAALAARGDGRAFEMLVRRHVTAVDALMRRMGADAALAEDLTQEAFLSAHRAIATWRAEGSFGAWVRAIAARAFLKKGAREIRRALNHAPLDEALTDDPPAGLAHLRMDLDRALAALTPPERLCVSMAHGAGFTHDEIAAALRLPLGTVKSHVARGLSRLRARLEASR